MIESVWKLLSTFVSYSRSISNLAQRNANSLYLRKKNCLTMSPICFCLFEFTAVFTFNGGPCLWNEWTRVGTSKWGSEKEDWEGGGVTINSAVYAPVKTIDCINEARFHCLFLQVAIPTSRITRRTRTPWITGIKWNGRRAWYSRSTGIASK